MSQAKNFYDKRVDFLSFGGVDARYSHTGTESSALVENFCIAPDGSLSKRGGFRRVLTLENPIRALWSGEIRDESVIVLLAGNQVIYPDIANQSFHLAGTTDTSEGKASFFCYRGYLYLTDGKSIYRITRTSVTQEFGYLPLLCRGWEPAVLGEIYEPLNLLTRKARLNYVCSTLPAVYFRTAGYAVETIDAVYRNGSLMSPDTYQYDVPSRCIMFPGGLASGDTVDAYVTFDATSLPYTPNQMNQCNAYTFGGVEKERVFLWGGNDKTVIYPSAYVSEVSMKASQKADPESGNLYFPMGTQRQVGGGRYNIRGMARQFDRLLIFTGGDLWKSDNTEPESLSFPAMNINTAIGCGSDGGVTVAGNSPISVGDHTVYLWTAETEELNDCNAYSISEAIDSLLSHAFFRNAKLFYCRERNELWLYSPDTDTTVWIYHLTRKIWVAFTGIDADGFFSLGSSLGFYKNASLFLFDKTLHEDLPDGVNARKIVARFRSNELNFDALTGRKLTAFTVSADSESDILFSFCGAGAQPVSRRFQPKNGHTHEHHRLTSGRFTSGYAELICDRNTAQTIHTLTIEVR